MSAHPPQTKITWRSKSNNKAITEEQSKQLHNHVGKMNELSYNTTAEELLSNQ